MSATAGAEKSGYSKSSISGSSRNRRPGL